MIGTVQKELFILKYDLYSRREIFRHTIDGVLSCRYRLRFSIVEGEQFGQLMRLNQKGLVTRFKRTWSSTCTGNSFTSIRTRGCWVEFSTTAVRVHK